MATDVEISRALNALSATLNDQRLESMDLERLEEIVVSSLGGERHLHLVHDAEHIGRTAWLHDDADSIVGRVDLEDGGHWRVQRYGPPLSGGYVPSAG